MSFVVVAPEVLAAAASDLAGIGSTLAQANAAALAPTTAVLAAGADEVSAAIASLFGAHGQAYQAVSAQMSAFHAQFMQALTGLMRLRRRSTSRRRRAWNKTCWPRSTLASSGFLGAR